MRRSRQTAAQLDIAIDEILEDFGAPQRDGEELVATARLLRDALPRFHPRFSFEEHLANRLAGMRTPGAAAAAQPIPIRPGADVPDALPPAHAEADWRRRGLVAGGAIASGVSLAIPLAGAALVVWRRSRSSGGLL